MASEHLHDTLNAVDESIDFFGGVVEGEGGADCAFDAKAMHEWLGTVVTGADGDAEAVEEGAEVKMVDVVSVFLDKERNDGIGITMSVPEEGHAVNRAKLLDGIAGELLLMAENVVHAEGADIIEGTGEGMGGDIVGGACLELVGQVIVGGVLKGDVLDHLATALIGGQTVEPRFLAVEDSHACGTIDFVPGEGEEVAIEVLHIDGHVGHGLCSVDEDGDAVLMSDADDFLHGVHRAEHIADVGAADEACAFGQQGFVGIHEKFALVGHGDDFQHRPFALAHHLPRDDVAVVLHGADEDFVALVDEGFAKGEGEQVDALGGASGEEDFGGGTGIDEATNGLAAGFVEVGCLLGKEVYATMHVGVHVVVFVHHRLHHTSGLLGGGSVVEIDEGVSIDFAGKDGEVVAYVVDGVHGNNRNDRKNGKGDTICRVGSLRTCRVRHGSAFRP